MKKIKFDDGDVRVKGAKEEEELRSVVLALGGFRRLQLLCLWQLSRRPGSSSNWASFSQMIAGGSRSGVAREGRHH
ncbi:hypothetical protein Q3G72_016867 [Acer saccharum]|nr:hypothetical protein Q3G72_016867 [Acer saccharum]